MGTSGFQKLFYDISGVSECVKPLKIEIAHTSRLRKIVIITGPLIQIFKYFRN
jgi:hypothetical protein